MFLTLPKRVFNRFGNTLPQNKDAEVAFARAFSFIQLFLSIVQLKSSQSSEFSFVFSQEIQMFRTLSFNVVLKKFTENTYHKLILSEHHILHKYRFFFFQSVSSSFSIITKKVNQIRNKVVCVAAHLVFVFCYAFTTGRWKKSEFYCPYFQTMLFLTTMNPETTLTFAVISL